jgi:hypothetical protein
MFSRPELVLLRKGLEGLVLLTPPSELEKQTEIHALLQSLNVFLDDHSSSPSSS